MDGPVENFRVARDNDNIFLVNSFIFSYVNWHANHIKVNYNQGLMDTMVGSEGADSFDVN